MKRKGQQWNAIIGIWIDHESTPYGNQHQIVRYARF